MNVASYPGQILYQVDGQVKYSSVSCGQQPWKDGSIEITAIGAGVVNCTVKPNYGKQKSFKLSKSTVKSFMVNQTNLLVHLKEGGNLRIQTRNEQNKRKLPKINNFLDILLKGELKCSERKNDYFFSLSPTSGNLVENHNNLKTPVKKEQQFNLINPMTTPSSIGKLIPYDGPNSADSDVDGLPLFDDVKDSDELDKENMDANHRSHCKPESIFHKRKESGSSLFMKSFEENKNSKTPTSSLKKPIAFYGSTSRGKQMVQASSQNFLEFSSSTRKPRLLGSPIKKVRLGDGFTFKGWQEKPRLFATDSSQPKLRGFSNLGNTCYMNAILQSLFSLEPFVEDVLNNEVYREMPRESLYKAVCQLVSIKKKNGATEDIQHLLRSLKGAISSTATRFSGYLQHDAHEFLGQCLDQLKEDVLKLNKNSASLKDVENTKQLTRDVTNYQNTPFKYPCAISRNFEFTVLHTIQCNKCREVVTKSEICHDLSLDIPRRRSSVSRISIQTALDQFFQSEPLEYTCEECGCKESTVKHSFTKLPRVLILQLKRYSFDVNAAHKICQGVLIPGYMTLARHCTHHSKPAHPLSCKPNRISMKPEMMSPGRAEGSERLARKRLSYEGGSSLDTPNGFIFKPKRLKESWQDSDTDVELSTVIDLTKEDKQGESNTDDKGKEMKEEIKTIEQMSEEEQLAFVIEMSRQESARKRTRSNEMTEEDQLAMVLEMSKHETSFTPQLTPTGKGGGPESKSQPTTPKSAFDTSKERKSYFDGSSAQRNRDSGIGQLNFDNLEEKSKPTGVPSNDSGISMEGVEPLLPDGRATSPNGTYPDHADGEVKGNKTEQRSSQERRTSSHEQTPHNYTTDTPLNEEDEELAIERALELSLKEFEEKVSSNKSLKQSTDEGTDCSKGLVYTKEEEEEMEKNYEVGHMPHSYKLLSIVSHIGSTSAIGHYISDVYDRKKAGWYSYDDSEVLRTSARRVQEARQKNGYIFFYMNKDLCT